MNHPIPGATSSVSLAPQPANSASAREFPLALLLEERRSSPCCAIARRGGFLRLPPAFVPRPTCSCLPIAATPAHPQAPVRTCLLRVSAVQTILPMLCLSNSDPAETSKPVLELRGMPALGKGGVKEEVGAAGGCRMELCHAWQRYHRGWTGLYSTPASTSLAATRLTSHRTLTSTRSETRRHAVARSCRHDCSR